MGSRSAEHRVVVTVEGTTVFFNGRGYEYLSESWMLAIPNCTSDRPCAACKRARDPQQEKHEARHAGHAVDRRDLRRLLLPLPALRGFPRCSAPDLGDGVGPTQPGLRPTASRMPGVFGLVFGLRMTVPERISRASSADLQRWALLAGTRPRTEAEEAELQALIRKLTALGHPLSLPCAGTARERD